MDGFAKDIRDVYADVSACLLALANALAAKGVLTKSEFAAAAQERLLALRELAPGGAAAPLPLLQMLATELERKARDA